MDQAAAAVTIPAKPFIVVFVRHVLSYICCDLLDVFTEKEVLNNMSISLKDQSGSSTLDCKLRSSGVGILIGMKLRRWIFDVG